MTSPAWVAIGARMDDARPGRLDSEGAAALDHMEKALELLDRCDGADEVGAHLDLAICRLRKAVAQSRTEHGLGPPDMHQQR
jgi:hypothetical protein